MPMPKPKKDETQDDFISRCMADGVMQSEYPDNDQRLAVCYDLWRGTETKQLVVPGDVEQRFMAAGELRIEERSDGDDGKAPVIVGYAAVFDKLSEDLGGFRERIAPKAFAESLKAGDDVRALIDHDPGRILGRTKAKTLSMAEDDHGLRVKIEPGDTTAGRDVLESIKRGDLDGMSFAFQTVSDRWETKDGEELRTLEKVRLIDVSVVTYPAYPDTSVAVRSREQWRKAEPERKPAAFPDGMSLEDAAKLRAEADQYASRSQLETDIARHSH